MLIFTYFIFLSFLLAVFFVRSFFILHVFLLYLFFHDLLKILSQYDPVIHISVDIILLFCLTRILLEKRKPAHKIPSKIITSLLAFLLVFIIQILNPWKLGFLPYVASIKTYLLPLCLFIVCYGFLRSKHLDSLSYLLVLLASIQAVLSILDWSLLSQKLPHFHPYYKNEQFLEALYRPFGLTNSPGKPSAWMVYGLFASFFLIKKGKISVLYHRFFHSLSWIVVFICQTRINIVRLLFVLLLGLVFKIEKKFNWMLLASFVLIFFLMHYSSSLSPRFKQVSKRTTSLLSYNTWANHREGILNTVTHLSHITLFGLGPGRIGSSNHVWREKIEHDPYVGNKYSFADNLVLTLFIELGIIGVVTYIFFVLNTLLSIWNQVSEFSKMIALFGVFQLIASFSTEAIFLAYPDAPLLWMFLARGLKERKKSNDIAIYKTLPAYS